MAANANQSRHDWALYSFLLAIMGLIIGGVGLIVALMLAEGRATRAEQQAMSAEQSAETEKIRSELQASRAEQKAEAEETRRYIAEEIAKANERAAVNSIRIKNLEEATEPPPASPPPN